MLAKPFSVVYAAVVSVCACRATALPMWKTPVPGAMMPGGKPLITSAGKMPTLPVTTVGPVLVIFGVAPRTAKLEAVPSICAVAGAEAKTNKAIPAIDSTPRKIRLKPWRAAATERTVFWR